MPTTSEGRDLNAVVIIFTVLTFASLFLRFSAVFALKRRLRVDDYLVLVAFASLMAMEAAFWWDMSSRSMCKFQPLILVHLLALNHNLGVPYAKIAPEDASIQHKSQYSTGITWTIATVTCKMAVLWLYLAIFTMGKMRIVVYIFMGLCVAYAITFIPIFMAACNPPSAAWDLDPMVALAKCRPIQQQEYASVSVNMFLDLSIVILPLPQIWKLQMAPSKKLFASFMFSFGLVIVGIMAWRIQTTVEFTKTFEWSQNLVKVALQSHLEVWLVIMAANLPTVAPLFTKVINPAMKNSFKSWGYSGSSSGKHTSGRTFGSRGGAGRTHADFDRLTEASGEHPMIPLESVRSSRTDHGEPAHRRSPSSSGMLREEDVRVESTKYPQASVNNMV